MLGTREPEFTERVWLTTRGKLADLIAQVRADQAAGIYPGQSHEEFLSH